MKLVIDANILLALMNPDSAASYLFSSLDADFFAPLYLKLEMDKHKSEFLSKSKLSEHEFEIRYAEFDEKVKFFHASQFKEYFEKASGVLADKKDSQYLALALSIKSSIWSNDPHLKQQPLVEVYTTGELIDKLLNGEF